MSLSPAAVRHITRRLGDGTDPESVVARRARDLIAECERIEARIRAASKRAKERGARAVDLRPSKADEAAARIETLAAIRVHLHVETGGTCVVCDLGLPFVRMHAHHILSGPERQLEERADTMAPVHDKCHKWLHGTLEGFDQREALIKLLAWCETTHRDMSAASTRKRIAKIDEARRATP